jgi:hypothetical protein
MNVKEMLLERGLSPTDADIVVDMATNVVNECMRTVDRLTAAAPEHLYAHVATLSTMLLEKHVNGVNRQMLATLLGLAKEVQEERANG